MDLIIFGLFFYYTFVILPQQQVLEYALDRAEVIIQTIILCCGIYLLNMLLSCIYYNVPVCILLLFLF